MLEASMILLLHSSIARINERATSLPGGRVTIAGNPCIVMIEMRDKSLCHVGGSIGCNNSPGCKPLSPPESRRMKTIPSELPTALRERWHSF